MPPVATNTPTASLPQPFECSFRSHSQQRPAIVLVGHLGSASDHHISFSNLFVFFVDSNHLGDPSAKRCQSFWRVSKDVGVVTGVFESQSHPSERGKVLGSFVVRFEVLGDAFKVGVGWGPVASPVLDQPGEIFFLGCRVEFGEFD